MDMRLSDLPEGILSRVTAVSCGSRLKKRLRDFGLVPGTEIICQYRSPDGGVAAVKMKETVVALRTRDLRHIRVSVR